MPAKTKLFEKKKDHKEILCSRIARSNAIRPCRLCIKCLVNNQYKKYLNIPQTPKAPKIKRTNESMRGRITVPKYPRNQIEEEYNSYMQYLDGNEIKTEDLELLECDWFVPVLIRPTFYL